MRELRFAVFGAGFWAWPQLSGWRELAGARPVAVFNRTVSKAEKLAEAFGIGAVYGDPEELLRKEEVDFVDVITGPEGHEEHVSLAARHRRPVVCQKPLSLSLESAERMARACAEAGVPLLVNENFRWQAPMRAAKRVLDAGTIGRPIRATIGLVSGYDVFANQPMLADLDRFVLTDMGTHVLDVTRFLLGEATALSCLTQRVNDIRGEDVATVLLSMASGATVVVKLAYARTPLEVDPFPEVTLFVEGTAGSLELAPGCTVRVTTAEGTTVRRAPPTKYAWLHPDYTVSQSAIVDCQRNLLAALRGEGEAETTVEDNLRTLRLVFGAYDSAARGGELVTVDANPGAEVRW